MRLIAFVLAAFAVSGPAAAEWKEFNSVSEGFGVVFPTDPDVEEVAKFEVVPGKTVPARIYSTRYGRRRPKALYARADAHRSGAPQSADSSSISQSCPTRSPQRA